MKSLVSTGPFDRFARKSKYEAASPVCEKYLFRKPIVIVIVGSTKKKEVINRDKKILLDKSFNICFHPTVL